MGKNRGGAPAKYKEKYCKEIVEYFNNAYADFREGCSERRIHYPTLYGFAASIGVHRDSINEWSNVHPKFSDALKKAKSIQADFTIQSAMNGICPQPFAIFMMKNNHNWTDKTETKNENSNTVTLNYKV